MNYVKKNPSLTSQLLTLLKDEMIIKYGLPDNDLLQEYSTFDFKALATYKQRLEKHSAKVVFGISRDQSIMAIERAHVKKTGAKYIPILPTDKNVFKTLLKDCDTFWAPDNNVLSDEELQIQNDFMENYDIITYGEAYVTEDSTFANEIELAIYIDTFDFLLVHASQLDILHKTLDELIPKLSEDGKALLINKLSDTLDFIDERDGNS